MHDKCKVLFHQGRKKKKIESTKCLGGTKTQLTFLSVRALQCTLGMESKRRVQVFQTGWGGRGSEDDNFKTLDALILEHH